MSGGGWVPCNAAWWEEVAAALVAAGQPWPEAAVLMDLRWWDDQERMSGGRVTRPGRQLLQRRWGLTERPTRRLMAAVDAWRDPAHADLRPDLTVPRASQPRTADVQAPSQSRTSTVPAAPPEHRAAPQGRTSDVQAPSQSRTSGAQAAPSDRPQREKTQTPSQPPPQPPPHGAPPGAARAGGAEQAGSVQGPSWLRAWAQHGPVPERVDPVVLGRALLAATAAVTGREVEPAWGGQQRQPWAAVGEGPLRLHGHADATLSPAHRLWESLGRPDLEAWLADVELLARAARECHAPVFAREIRGQGEAGRADHSRSLRTVLAVDRFGDRLEVARRWAATLAPAAAPALRLVTPQEAEARAAEQAALARLTDAVGDRGLEDLYASLAEACRPCETWRPALAELGRAPDPRGAALALERELAREARAAGRVAGGGR